MISKLGIKIGLLLWVIIGIALVVLAKPPEDPHAFNPWEIAQKSFNILLLIDVILYFAGGSLKEFFKSREDRIKSDLTQSAESKNDLENRLTELKNRMSSLDTEIDQILGKARKEANEERDEIISKARKEAGRMIEMTKLEIDVEYSQANKLLQKKVAELALIKSEELIKKNITKKDQGKLVEEYIEYLKEVK